MDHPKNINTVNFRIYSPDKDRPLVFFLDRRSTFNFKHIYQEPS